MEFSLTCKIINTSYDFVVDICKENMVDDKKVKISKLSVAHLKKLILKEAKSELSNVEDANKLEIWRVEVNLIGLENNIFTFDDVKTIGTKMEMSSLKRYFDNDEKKPKDDHLHVIVVPPADKCLPTFYLSNMKFAVINIESGLISFFRVKNRSLPARRFTSDASRT